MAIPQLTNAMSVDVEDYFQVSAFESHIPPKNWDDWPVRVEGNTHRVLDIFAEHNTSATFFVLGWVAKRYPALIQRIVSEGHELASHGMNHVRVTRQTPDEFREDVTQTKLLLEELGGVEVKGYRAASYSIGASNLWALDVLHEVGYRYSSSIYPIRHDHYGMPEAPRFRHYPRGTAGILEVPITTVTLGENKFPCGGGGYFRLFPYALSRWALQRVNQLDQQVGIFYFHPWEIDPGQPRVPGLGAKTRFRHYLNLERFEPRLRRLLQDFNWDRMDRLFLPE